MLVLFFFDFFISISPGEKNHFETLFKDCYFNSISRDLVEKRDFISRVLADVGMKPVIPEGG